MKQLGARWLHLLPTWGLHRYPPLSPGPLQPFSLHTTGGSPWLRLGSLMDCSREEESACRSSLSWPKSRSGMGDDVPIRMLHARVGGCDSSIGMQGGNLMGTGK